MSLFVDTSALLAVMVAADECHAPACLVWRDLMAGDEPLLTTNYVLLESCAVLQRRIGMKAVQLLVGTLAPVLQVHWVEPHVHEAAVGALLAANSRDLSLVDCVSFAAMRELGLTRAFTFDQHFADQGFEIVPPS